MHALLLRLLQDYDTALPRFRTEFPYRLGSTDPCSTAVHMEPFSTSVFKVLV